MFRSIALASVLVVGSAFAASAQTANIVGSYSYTGTMTDGSVEDPGTLKVTAQPSGAYEVKWDGGDYVGIGQVQGNLLAIASVVDGKNTIMMMTINPDGTLAGKWWRRTDPGAKGTEVWAPSKK